ECLLGNVMALKLPRDAGLQRTFHRISGQVVRPRGFAPNEKEASFSQTRASNVLELGTKHREALRIGNSFQLTGFRCATGLDRAFIAQTAMMIAAWGCRPAAN